MSSICESAPLAAAVATRQSIIVRGLEVWAHIGVPDEERSTAQRLLIDLEVEALRDFAELDDAIANAIDYDDLSRRVKALAEAGERRLIETLAADVAHLVLADDGAGAVRVGVRKFILPDTEHVAVEYCLSKP